MALAHIRSLQSKRGEFTYTEYAVLEVIATDMGNDHKPAWTSYRAIAARANVHYNTAAYTITRLVTEGYLLLTKKGKYHTHALAPSFNYQQFATETTAARCDNDCDNQLTHCHKTGANCDNVQPPANGNCDNLYTSNCDNQNNIVTTNQSDIVTMLNNQAEIVTMLQNVMVRLSQLEEALSQRNASLSQSPQNIVTKQAQIVTINQRGIVTKEERKDSEGFSEEYYPLPPFETANDVWFESQIGDTPADYQYHNWDWLESESLEPQPQFEPHTSTGRSEWASTEQEAKEAHRAAKEGQKPVQGIADEITKEEAWKRVCLLVEGWAEITHKPVPYLHPDTSRNKEVYDNYHFRAAELLMELDWDVTLCLSKLKAKRVEMVNKRLSPVKLSGIVCHLIDDLKRVEVEIVGNRNGQGSVGSNANLTAEQWAAIEEAERLGIC